MYVPSVRVMRASDRSIDFCPRIILTHIKLQFFNEIKTQVFSFCFHSGTGDDDNEKKKKKNAVTIKAST